jgi:ABC-type phosphate transport system substrate-binding protein
MSPLATTALSRRCHPVNGDCQPGCPPGKVRAVSVHVPKGLIDGMSALAHRGGRRIRIVLAACVAALGVAALAPGAAHAAFTTPPCNGDSIAGNGATFQATAEGLFTTQFAFSGSPTGCAGGSGATVTYTANGSGAGRRSLGDSNGGLNPGCKRNLQVRYGASDDPPNATQKSQMELGESNNADAGCTGGDKTPDDNGTLNTIPVAAGAVSLVVNMPTGGSGPGGICQVTGGNLDPGPVAGTARFTTTKALLEAAWAGDASADTWGELVPGIEATPACAGAAVKRVVRLDSSGTTFAFKDWLNHLNGSRGWLTTFNTPNDLPWPNDSGGTAVIRGNGNPGVASGVLNNPGSIGYVELSVARQNGFFDSGSGGTTSTIADPTFWIRVPNGSNAPTEPTKDPGGTAGAGFRASSPAGANCDTVAFHDGASPTLPSSTTSVWGNVSGVDSATGYGVCTMTYILAFSDNGKVYNALSGDPAGEERKARTLKDFLLADLSDGNQNLLPSFDYSKVPATVLPVARAGANAMDFTGGGGGQTGGGGGGGTTGGGTTGGGSTPPPPPGEPSNVFTLSSSKVGRDGTITLSLQAPGAGAFAARASGVAAYIPLVGEVAKKKRKPKPKNLTFGTGTATATSAGPVTLTIKPSAAASAALRKGRAIRVNVQVTFQPAGGGATSTQTKGLTVKGTKAKKKKKRSRR